MVDVIGEDRAHKLEITCPSCASRLQYTRREIQVGYTYDYGGGRDRVEYIACPRCRHEVRLK